MWSLRVKLGVPVGQGTDAELLCDTTAVLDGEGIRSVLKLVAVPVNAPPQELLSLLETLVLRYVATILTRIFLSWKTGSSSHLPT